MEPAPDLLFVYGTLRPGRAHHSVLLRSGAELVERGWIKGRLYDLGEYPGAVPSDLDTERVVGELYRWLEPRTALKVIDEFEEYDAAQPARSLFLRQPVEVYLDGGRRVRAWTYFLPSEPAGVPRILHGDYARA